MPAPRPCPGDGQYVECGPALPAIEGGRHLKARKVPAEKGVEHRSGELHLMCVRRVHPVECSGHR
eukprot:2712906-Alexandrium_andersonii.AAC.1